MKNLTSLVVAGKAGSRDSKPSWLALSLLLRSALCWLHSQTGLLRGVTASSSRLSFRWPTHSAGEGMWLSQEDSAEVPRVILIGPDWVTYPSLNQSL